MTFGMILDFLQEVICIIDVFRIANTNRDIF